MAKNRFLSVRNCDLRRFGMPETAYSSIVAARRITAPAKKPPRPLRPAPPPPQTTQTTKPRRPIKCGFRVAALVLKLRYFSDRTGLLEHLRFQMPIFRPVGPVLSAQGKALGMVLECSSALKGPFTALYAVRFCYGCCLNGPFQGRIVGGHGTQGFADFALGCRNEPFRLKDGLIRGTIRVALSTFEARHGVLCGFPLLALFEVALSDAMWIRVLASEPIPRKGSGVRHPPVFTIARPFASLFLGICL